MAKVLFHPALLARRAREIAEGQRARLEQDAAGRPFIRAADPLAEAPIGAPQLCRCGATLWWDEELKRDYCPWCLRAGRAWNGDPPRLWLIRLMRALGREAGPPVGRPVARP